MTIGTLLSSSPSRAPRLGLAGSQSQESGGLFDPAKIARYDEKKITALISNPGLVRNRLKIRSTVSKVRAFLKMREEFTSFSDY